jgi:rod shape-determining protein MreB
MSVYHTIKSLVSKWQQLANLDFGSSQCRLMLGNRLVWNEPSLVAWDSNHNQVVAVGSDAAKYRGKSPLPIVVSSPISKGVVANLPLAQGYLETMFLTIKKKKKIPFLPLRCNYLTPSQATPVEVKHFARIITQAGMSPAKKMSVAVGLSRLPLLRSLTQVHGVISMGAQSVSIGIIMAGKLVKEKKICYGAGADFTQAVIEVIKQNYQLSISWETALKIKHQIGSLPTHRRAKNVKLTVRGKGESGSGLASITVQTSDLMTKFVFIADQLLTQINLFLDSLSADIYLQLQEQGFYLTGGASLLTGWKEILEEKLNLPIVMGLHPHLDGVKGLAANGD